MAGLAKGEEAEEHVRYFIRALDRVGDCNRAQYRRLKLTNALELDVEGNDFANEPCSNLYCRCCANAKISEKKEPN